MGAVATRDVACHRAPGDWGSQDPPTPHSDGVFLAQHSQPTRGLAQRHHSNPSVNFVPNTYCDTLFLFIVCSLGIVLTDPAPPLICCGRLSSVVARALKRTWHRVVLSHRRASPSKTDKQALANT